MERKMKRILGILLSFVLVVGMMPTVSLADTITNHTGTVTFTEGENAPVEVGDILKKGATLTTTADRLYIYDENNRYIETVEKNDSRILAKDYTVTKVKSQISGTEREWFVYLDGYVQDYIWVGGIQVTEDNAANITGEESPTAYYDAGTRTLTLKDYHYSGHGYCLGNVEGGIVIAKNESVTIELIGENSITMEAIANETPSRDNSYGIYGWLTGNSKPSITIIGKGSLATKGGNAKSNSSGIYVTYNITFEGGTVQAEGGNVDVYRSTGVANQGKGITIDGGNLVAKGGVSSGQYGSSYGVYAGIDDVTDKTVFESGSLKATGNTKAIYHSIVNYDNEDHEWGGLSVTENRTLFKAGGSDETAEDVSSYSDEKFVYVTAPMRMKQTVTFKVVNGSWDEGEGEAATADKTVTLTGYEGDTLKLKANEIPAVGSKPKDNTYKEGSWDVTPSAETAITEATTYTYTYAKKDSISKTVTFKVVNGSWDEGEGEAATADKTVTLTGYEGDTLKLVADQIPVVGSKPKDNTYKEGSWDVTPSTETEITAATTYTYTYAKKDAAVVTNTPAAKTLTYTGQVQELVIAGVADGGEMQYALGTESEATEDYSTSIPTGTDAGTYYVWYRAYVGEKNFTEAECVTASIAKRSVTLTSASDEKEYDGDALTNDEVTVTGDGFVTGEGATYDVTGTRTLVGSSENAFTYTLNEGTKADNYDITPSYGTLTVTNRNTKYEVTLKANSGTEKYDGSEKTVSGYTIDGTAGEGTGESVVTSFTASNGKIYTVTGMSAEVTGTNAGEYTVNVTGTPEVKDADGNDVTAQFAVSSESGKLTIDKRSVTLTSATDTKVYDGKALSNDEITVSEDGFAEGEGATYDVTGSQTLAGESANAFTYALSDGTIADNYDITTVEGKLTVTKSDSSGEVTAVSGLVYDGKAKALVTAGKTEGGTLMYRLGTDGKWQQDIPEATDAGTYKIYYYIKGDDNHKDDGSEKEPKGSVETTIKKAAQDKPAETFAVAEASDDKTADGKISGLDKAKTYQYSADDGKTWTDVKAGSTEIVVKSGTYQIRYAEDKNHEAGKAASVKVTAKAAPSPEPVKKDATINLKSVTQKNNKVQISWTKVNEADGYDVYVHYCGSKAKKPVKTIKKNTTTKTSVAKIDGKKINQKKNFHVKVYAYKMVNGKKEIIAKTITAHLAGAKSVKYTNPKALKLTKSTYNIKVKKTAKIKAKVTLENSSKKLLPKSHAAKLRYKSSNTKIATVDKNGKITGKSKGTCYIYVYTVNGLMKKAKITVK